jgi:hypothetical protein
MKKDRRRRLPILLLFTSIALGVLACSGDGATETPDLSTRDRGALATGTIAFGFFGSPPRITFESVLDHFEDLGTHADFILMQPNVPWEDFVDGAERESQPRRDLLNQASLAHQNGLDWVVVVDPLNGLNRREFAGLPASWDASFANPDVRSAFKNFTSWVLAEMGPRYLGLASEINTYADAHPEDFPHYLSLYRETYAMVKEESPATLVFVTFQWEDLNNLFPEPGETRQPFDTKWEQIETFEPELDLWVISSYPFVHFTAASQIPPDYYTPLLLRTGKPLAVAEGGFPSRPHDPFPGQVQDQVDYLNAINGQVGHRLRFWVYLLLTDLDGDSYAESMRQQGVPERDITTLGYFVSVGLKENDGTPKPGLAAWDRIRAGAGDGPDG